LIDRNSVSCRSANQTGKLIQVVRHVNTQRDDQQQYGNVSRRQAFEQCELHHIGPDRLNGNIARPAAFGTKDITF
jgi:hypothetical protein